MASRFFHKFSGTGTMSRSTTSRLLGGRASSAARAAAAPAPRYFNVFPCSHSDAKTRLTTTGMTSTIMNGMKPAFLDFARVKRTFSDFHRPHPDPTTKILLWKPKFWNSARKPLSVVEAVRKDVNTTIALMFFSSLCVIYVSAVDNTSSNGGSSHCSNCCNCPCHGSNPKVQ